MTSYPDDRISRPLMAAEPAPGPDHDRRLRAIAALRVVSRDPNGALDEIAIAAARIFGVPHALITIGVAGGAWYQGQFGLPAGFSLGANSPDEFVVGAAGAAAQETTLKGTVLTETVIVPDLLDNPSTVASPATAAGARFYAGVPLVTTDGGAVGTLCLLDEQPRHFSRKDVELLRALANRTTGEMELRLEHARVEERLRSVTERSREKAEIAAWTAHELKNPLTVIKGISSMLAADPKFPLEMRTDFMHAIGRQVDRMLRMVDETLDLTRLDAGLTLSLSMQEIDLAERLVSVAEFYQQTSSRHDIRLDLADGSHEIVGDRDKLDGVLFNVLGNAVKYSPEGGEITIRTRLLPDSVRISISDQGLGMDDQQLSCLFGRFARMHAESQPRIKGTGLGLFLVKHVVERHHGRIWAESKRDCGSTFHVVLPRAPSPISAD